MSYGTKTFLGINFQNSYGTLLTNSIYWLPFLSESLTIKKEQLTSEGMRGVFDDGQNYDGMNSIEGELVVESHPISIGVLLKAALGAPTTVTSTGVYTHTFKPRTADFDNYAANIPLNIVKNLGDVGSAHQYYDMVGNKLSFSIANGEFLKTSIGFMGGKYSQVAAPAATLPTGDSLFTWNVASMSIAGAANADIKELSVEIDESLENIHTVNGSKYPSRTKRSGFRTVSISGTILFDTQSEYQEFLSQTERSFVMTMKTANQVQSGYYEEFTIKAPLMRYTDFPLNAGGPGKIEVGFTSKGSYSTTSATALEFVLVNTKAAY